MAQPGDPHVASVVETIKTKLRNAPLADILAELGGYIPFPLLKAAREHLEQEARDIRILRDPPAIEAENLGTWYAGPSNADQFWPPVRRYFEGKWNNPVALQQLDTASTRIVADLGNPHSPRFSTRGLVVGDVQSGKTSNFTSTIAKAADAGYRLFVVLSGTKNKLRKQTQDRLVSDLVSQDRYQGWLVLTGSGAREDFGVAIPPPANQVLSGQSSQRILVVIKKHSGRLQYFLNWLRGASAEVLLRTPVLIIDDEADEASINTAKAIDERTRVNDAIVSILKLLPRAALVGYTATPYANFFIDARSPDDIYPRDFIINLPTSREYFGYERIFGRERTRFDETDADIDGYDMIRNIPDDEAQRLRPPKSAGAFSLELAKVPSLVDAIDWFLMVSAARRARGQGGQHSSMLIHTSQLTRIHRMFKVPIEGLLATRRREFAAGDGVLLEKLRLRWEEECDRVNPADFGNERISFDRLVPEMGTVAGVTKVVIENSLSPEEERLVYGSVAGTFIVVGGDVLSRGLTIEGLTVSYFTRSASTYDTLMQMGRWFGYRPGHEEMPRIWMTGDLRSSFYELGGIDREMRQLIDRSYSGHITPANFAPMIRIHPSLAVTSRMKMSRATLIQQRLSYGNTRVQTILFSLAREVLVANAAAAGDLVSAAMADGVAVVRGTVGGSRLLRGVDAAHVLRFLEAYHFHERSWQLNAEAICKYVRSERDAGSLDDWSVVVIEGDGKGERVRFGAEEFRCVIRSRLDIPGVPYANIKSLMSEDDALADVDVAGGRPQGIEAIIARRNEVAPRTGLLVIYPIDRRSEPRLPAAGPAAPGAPDRRRRVRVPLDAPLPVIGVGLVFPRAVNQSSQEGVYVQQRIEPEEYEEPEGELADEDNA